MNARGGVVGAGPGRAAGGVVGAGLRPAGGRKADLRPAGAAVGAWVTAAVLLGLPARTAAGTCGVAGLLAVAALARRAVWSPAVALALVGIAAAAGVTGLRVAQRDAAPLHDLVRRHARVTARFTVADDPRPIAAAGRPGYAVPASLTRVSAAGRTVTGKVRTLVLADGTAWGALLPSQRIDAAGSLEPPRGGDLTAAVLSVRGPPRPVGRPSAVQRAAGGVRAALRHACRVLPQPARGLLPALVDGDTSGLDTDLSADFRATGLTHVLAVSGTNCALTVGAILCLLRWARAGPRLTALLAALGLLGFVVLARPSPSVLRAAVMAALVLLALATGRERPALPVLSAAVAILVLTDPALARAPGFVLSVLATAGILVLAPGWRDRLEARLPGWLAEPLAVAAAANVAVLPALAAIGGQVSLVAIPANLLAAPAVAPATVLGVLAAVLAPATVPVAAAPVWLAGWPVRWLVAVARVGARVPHATVAWPSGLTGGLLLTVALVPLVAVIKVPGLRRTALIGVLAGAAVLVPLRMLLPGWPPAGWVMVACDVGQGDALALAAGPGTAVVVDTGPDPRPVDSCLGRLGVRQIPLLVLTHLHADHVDGLPGVLRDRSVAAVETGPLAQPPTGLHLVQNALRPRGLPLGRAEPGTAVAVGPLRIDVLGPAHAFRGTRSDPNNSSVALRVRVAGQVLLLGADMELDAQRELLDSGLDLRAEVLKVPHHGSAYLDPRFVEAVQPRVGIISVGANNDYGHPARSTLTLLARRGIKVFRTDQDGDVAVCVTGGTLTLRTRAPP